MSKFTDTPYFLLNDFMRELVEPFDDSPLAPNIVNEWKDIEFVDIFYTATRDETIWDVSTTLEDNLAEHPDAVDGVMFYQEGGVVWNGFVDTSKNINYDYDRALTPALVRGEMSSIVVDGGPWVELFASVENDDDIENNGYIPFRFTPVYEEPEDKKFFKFDLSAINILIPDASGSPNIYNSEIPADEPYYDSPYVTIITYDHEVKTTQDNYTLLDNGMDIYFRKDSSFHEWLRESAEQYYLKNEGISYDIRNYVNTDKMFIYFGKMYILSDGTTEPFKCHIIFDGIKDYAQRALPANNRKPNFMEFMDTFFDKQYSESYELLKNVWTLRDARECDETFLGYIPRYYNMPNYDGIDRYVGDQYREYAYNLVELLKHKGSYASLRIIYDIFTKSSPNILTIYERWYDSDIYTEGIVDQWLDVPYVGSYFEYPYDETDGGYRDADGRPFAIRVQETTGIPYEYAPPQPPEKYDHDYVSLTFPDKTVRGINGYFVGAGRHWYLHGDTRNYPKEGELKLTPAYRVDLDLNVFPVADDRILPKSVIVNMYNNWEAMRPVNRQAEYNLIYAPFLDTTGQEFSLYYGNNNGWQALTSSNINVTENEKTKIEIQREPETEWLSVHNLGTTDVIVNCYNNDFEKMVPSGIEIVDENTVRVDFSDSYKATGIIVVSEAKSSTKTLTSEWELSHAFNRKEVIVQVRNDTSNTVVYPDSIKTVDAQTKSFTTVEDITPTVVYKKGLTVGDGANGSIFTDTDIWEFQEATLITDTSDPDYGWWVWTIEHPYDDNGVRLTCYDDNGDVFEPRLITFDRTSKTTQNPMVRIRWATKTEHDVNGQVVGANFKGFVAIDNFGNIIDFDNIIPLDFAGDMLPLGVRVSIETEDDVYISLREDDVRTVKFRKPGEKVIHYETFVELETTTHHQDELWHYYTFKLSNEALEQLNIRDYEVVAIELINNRIDGYRNQKVVYSKLSGIYKPFGVNFIGHFRILKDPAGFAGIFGLLDTEFVPVLDTDGNLMAG